MFRIDHRIRGIPVRREQVRGLFQSSNQVHVAIEKHGPSQATAYVVGLASSQGVSAAIYLYLIDNNECAVYLPEPRWVAVQSEAGLWDEALAFLDNMGFMMTNVQFASMPPEEQDRLIASSTVFRPEPIPSAATEPEVPVATARIGRLLAAFCLALALLGLAGCKTISTKDQEEATIHYDLGVQSQTTNPPAAIQEFQRALELDPEFAEAWHAKGILLHVVYGRLDEAKESFEKALKFRPKFPVCRTNLGNLYLDQKRYEEAIASYQEALSDMGYMTPWFALANMGWAQYKSGKVKEGIGNIKSAAIANPKFCAAHRNLGIIYEEQGNWDESCKQVRRFRDSCSDSSEAHRREAICFFKEGKPEEAKISIAACQKHALDMPSKEACQQVADQLKL